MQTCEAESEIASQQAEWQSFADLIPDVAAGLGIAESRQTSGISC